MKIGLRTNNLRKHASIEEVIEWAGEVALDALDLPEPDDSWVHRLKDAGLSLGSIDSDGTQDLLSPDPKRQQAGVEAAKKRVEAIAKVGGKVLFEVLKPADKTQSRADSFAIWKETYPEVAAAAERHGVAIAIEPFPGPPPTYPVLGSNPDMLRRMFEAVPSRALGLCYDPSHFLRLGIDAVRLLEEFHDRVNYVHLKDCKIISEGTYLYGTLGESFGRRFRNGGGYWRYCIPGRGDLGWDEIIFTLGAVGYDGVLSIELEDHQYNVDGEAQKRGIVLAMEYVRRFF